MMEQATKRHFFYHGNQAPESEMQNCHWCQLRAFPTHKPYPVTVINDVDDEVLPRDFRFINDFVLGRGVTPAEASFRSGCDCAKDDHCQYSGCHCLGEVSGDEDSSEDEHGRARIGRKLHVYAYHSKGAHAGMLTGKMLRRDNRAPIYECHDGCACSAECPNRVVERGRRVPLQIFRTPTRGWGVKSTVDIQKGQFVDRYVGEVITAREADARRKRSAISQKKDVYLFELDKFYDPDSPDPRLREPSFIVDGEYMSGPTRFINHSCEPNLRIYARVGDHADKHLHDVALFAIKDIPRGTELTFDYVDGAEEEGEDDRADPVKLKDMTRCLCGSESCRGYLW